METLERIIKKIEYKKIHKKALKEYEKIIKFKEKFEEFKKKQ